MIECDLYVVESESEWRSVRKSEGESKPTAHFDNATSIATTTKLIHTAHPTPSLPLDILLDILLDDTTTILPIEFHTATDICFEICLQIIYQTHDIVITHSCFTTCARYIASRSSQEVVKK